MRRPVVVQLTEHHAFRCEKLWGAPVADSGAGGGKSAAGCCWSTCYGQRVSEGWWKRLGA